MMPARGMYEDSEHYFTRMVEEKGYLNLTSLEQLAIDVIQDLNRDYLIMTEERDEMESMRDEYESEAYGLREEVAILEDDLREAREECSGNDETTQDDEVEFLKTLIADLEEELAAIDNGAAA
jgi:phage host-nuclease inhibitor protein Gam